jgi:tetratricopeptide (TPR) repeat protein
MFLLHLQMRALRLELVAVPASEAHLFVELYCFLCPMSGLSGTPGRYSRVARRDGEVAGVGADNLDSVSRNVSSEVRARTIDTVVQAGTVTGGVHVHHPPYEPGPVVPRQLPAPPARFTGRTAELARLSEALDRAATGTMVVSAVGGAGGIGKTWLVLHWAHLHLDRFPDGQLHVDLRGFSPDSEPMPASVAVRSFLTALGIGPEGIPAEEHAQAALYRSLLATKRMLIVLDNAATTAQVTPLLPGSATCTVLITSRRRLSGLINAHSAEHLALDVLPATEAHALLSRRIGAARLAGEPNAAEAIVAVCGGFPLALSVVASHAAAHPQLPLSTLVDELRETGLDGLDDSDPVASVPVVLSWSYRALPAQQAKLFVLLGIAPGPDISLTAATSLAGLPAARVRGVLRELEQASLLVRYATDRYRMHDLIRACARSRAESGLPSAERQSALRRVVDFYLHTSYHAHLALEPHDAPITLGPPNPGCIPHRPTSHTTALAWFTTEHLCLLAAQTTATAFEDASIEWQFAWTLTAYHNLRGFLHDDLRTWQRARKAVKECADPSVHTLVRQYLGHAYLRMGKPRTAYKHLRRALATAKLVGDLYSRARIHRVISVMWEHLDNNQRALRHAYRALELFRTVGDLVWEADTLGTIGWCEALVGRYRQARQHCEQALPVLDHNHLPGAADTLDTLGYITHHSGQHDDALQYLHRALALYRELGDVFHVPDTLDRTSHVLIALDRIDDAYANWQEALELYRTQQRTTDMDRVQRHLDTPRDQPPRYAWPHRHR